MSFKLPDLIIESILRDGFANARRDETIIDDVFCDLSMPFASKKYGEKEINKIKDMIRNKEVSIVHSFNLVNANMPCISIQMSDDRENPDRSHMGDMIHYSTIPFNTPEKIQATIFVESFTPVSYDTNTGKVVVDPPVSLATVHTNLIFVDGAGVEHTIVGGISNEPGDKYFFIGKSEEVSLDPGAEIKTSIDYDIYERHGNIEETQLILGIHSKDALLTKYLYTLVKYFTLSRKRDLTTRGFQLNTYSGSDFHRNTEYAGDVVFSRFFNVTGILQHSWRSDKVQLVDNIEVKVLVPIDRLTNDDLDREDQTVQVTEPKD